MRAKHLCSLGAGALLLVVPIACDPDALRAPAIAAVDQPGPVFLDSILLQETDAFFVGQPASLALDPMDGSFYIADGYAARAYRFARSGAPIRAYGRPGDGPGEIRDTRAAFPVNDTIMAVDDFRERTLELFHKHTGVFIGRREHGGISGGQVSWNDRQDTICMAYPDFPEGEFSISMWVPDTDHLQHLTQAPQVYRNHPHYFAASGLSTSLAPWQDYLLLGYGSLPNIYLLNRDGTVRDSIHLPVVRRRPIAEHIVEIVETRSEPEKRASMSVLLRLFRRVDGSYGFVHSNPFLEGEWPSIDMWARYYVGVLTADLESACADLPLDLGERVHAIFASRGDTLFVLQQEVIDTPGEEPYAQSWIKPVLIDASGCEWLSTRIR